MYEIKRYTARLANEWNLFVAGAKNGSFLFDRRYMDYHGDRLEDYSLMIYRKGKLFALLPANKQGAVLLSHQGLTYGGLVTDQKATAEHVCETFVQINETLRTAGFCRVVYKPIPWIYHHIPAEEDLYALVLRCHAQLTRRDVSATVSLYHRLPFSESRLSGVRKARRCGIVIRESGKMEDFWPILSENIHCKYGVSPVHSLEEMSLLKSRFPEQIRLFMAYSDGLPVGGTVLYLTSQVVHTQYISASPKGKQMGALDLLFHKLLNEMDFRQPYFDFGTSALTGSNELNSALMFQKQGFGGRSVCYDRYEYEL